MNYVSTLNIREAIIFYSLIHKSFETDSKYIGKKKRIKSLAVDLLTIDMSDTFYFKDKL